MLSLGMKQFLALFLCGLLAYPVPLFAESEAKDSSEVSVVPAKSAPNVTLRDFMTRASVTEGTLKLGDTSGTQIASLLGGEARPFGEPSAAVPAAAIPPAPAPQIGGGTGMNRGWVLALGIAIVGTSLAIAALVRANDIDDRSR